MKVLKTSVLWASVVVWCLHAGGCGGGGSGSSKAAQKASAVQVRGNIVSVNGDSAAVAGVVVAVPGAGKSATSDGAGRFDLGSLRSGTVTIQVTTPSSGSDDPMEIEVELEKEGKAELHISIDGGQVVRLSVDRSCGEGEAENETCGPLTGGGGSMDGQVRLRKREGGGQELEVEMEHLRPETEVEVHLARAGGDDSRSLGALSASGEGKADLQIRTEDGDRLPHDVADVAELEGFQVEVRDAATGAVLFTGTIPAMGSIPTCQDDSGGHGSGEDGNQDDMEDGEARLAAAPGVAGVAEVELRSDPSRGEEKFEVHVSGVDGTLELEVWLEDPASPGTLRLVGALSPEGTSLDLERNTRKAQALPFAATRAADLAGLSIEVRKKDGGVVMFAGTTPALRQF